jgi:hypothetical protein
MGSYELLVWIIRTVASGSPGREPAADHTRWYANQLGHGCPGASRSAAAPDTQVSRIGLVPASGDGPLPARAPGADQGSGPGQGAAPDQIRADPGRAGTTPDESQTSAAAVAAYRASLQTGRPLSERKLAGMFGKTSRRWARCRMAEARQA